MRVSLVPKTEIGKLWPEINAMLQRAIDKDPTKYDTIDIFEELLTNKQTLWIAFNEENEIKAAYTVRIVDYPKNRFLHVEFAAGDDVDEWLPLFYETFCKYAKDMGCSHVETYGRLGWGPRLEALGAKKVSMTYRVDLAGQDEEGTG